MKRLARDAWVTQIPQPRDQQYLYMPNPTLIHPSSSKIRHFLGLVDLYTELGQPDIYEVEPDVMEGYRPDAYTRLGDLPVVIELQLSKVTQKVMQTKVDNFAKAFHKGKHDAKTLWIVSDRSYDLDIPKGFEIKKGRSFT